MGQLAFLAIWWNLTGWLGEQIDSFAPEVEIGYPFIPLTK
jgi:hypothetical protein